jgi:cellulose synthase/poly-beta-1,6-N-acetylglucosamine synthase-like glycosyltransferase
VQEVKVLSCISVILAGLLVIPVTVFFLEMIAAIARRQASPNHQHQERLDRVAVLVPAHNEGAGVLSTLTDIKGQLRPGDRLLVVADNCRDDTAVISSGAGAEVIERHDPTRFGKGYALDFGLRHLAADPPHIVIVVDADCRLAEDTIARLATACSLTRQPVQALYLMAAPNESTINYRVAEFAWRVKNWLRPLGLAALGLPCQLMGTGMAFPWDVIRSANLATGWIVEDLKLGLDLTLAGHAPLFCPSARVISAFPSSVTGAASQRKRWEQGHINTILKAAPSFFYLAVTRRNWALLALTLDLAVPPLSLLAMLVVGMFIAAAMAGLLGLSTVALVVSAASLLGFICAAFLAWLKCGRDVLPPRAMWSIAPYVLGKLPLYRHILSDRADARWTRTDRSKSG